MAIEKLTTKMQKFADIWLENGNVVGDACRDAGYKTKYPTTVGSRVLQSPLVREYINKKRAEIRKIEDDLIYSKIMTRAEIQFERNRIASSDLGKILDDGFGKIRENLNEDARKSISSIVIKEITNSKGEKIVTAEITLWDKLKALKELDDHLKEREMMHYKQDCLIIENALQEPIYDFK